LSKKDGSIATFVLVHNSLGLSTIDKLGNEEQRKRMMPDLISFNKICCWALTEPEFGSDASSI
jgi:acyl-CoA oxidase